MGIKWLIWARSLVRPTEAEGELGSTGSEHLGEWALEHLTPVEPIVVVAETVYAVLARHLGLRFPHFRDAQVVEAEICGQVRLIVSWKERLCLSNVTPLGKALAPPGVVLRNGVELGQVEGDGTNIAEAVRGDRLMDRHLSAGRHCIGCLR